MKNLFLPVFLLAGSLFASCTTAVFKPAPSANPWDDNYLSVAKMEDYRQWGTYNVHDPSCRKLGDYYYMYSTDAKLKKREYLWDTSRCVVPKIWYIGNF